MLAGDSGRPLPHRREHASCPTHADCTAHTAQVDKLTRDHQRAKNPEQRNEIYAKLHKTKRQLEELQGQ